MYCEFLALSDYFLEDMVHFITIQIKLCMLMLQYMIINAYMYMYYFNFTLI